MTATSPRGLLTAASLALLLLAGACRDEPKVIVKKVDGTVAVTAVDGAILETAGDGKALPTPEGLPAFAPAYPGARLATRIGGGEAGGGKGALLVFETTDAVEKVTAFYDARAKEAGAAASVVVNEADSAVRIFGGKDHEKGAMVAISKSEDKPGTEIVITSGMAKADIVHIERKPEAWREAVRMPVRLQ
jgi:hypothetical protein